MTSSSASSAGPTILPAQFYEEKLSTSAKNRKPPPLWALMARESDPAVLSMLAGKPNPATFPFEYINIGVRSPGADNKDAITKDLVVEGDELNIALQYGLTTGVPELRAWLEKLMRTEHSREKSEGWRCSVGAGSQDLLYKVLNALLSPGDTLIVEGPTYPGATPIMAALGIEYITIDVDEQGIQSSKLATILETWAPTKPLPKALYTIPFGSNPAGVTASYQRRVEILKLSKKYNFMIIEDDPYYFLYYGDTPRPASYFTLEKRLLNEVGRVLRLDSFSKIMAAGLRIGWLTGPEALLKAVEAHSMCNVVQASTVTQILILKVLREWGIEGFFKHASGAASFYKRRRDVMAAALNRHLAGHGEWTQPDASMFFWIKLRLPPAKSNGLEIQSAEVDGDSTTFIRSKALPGGVLVLPGATSYVDGRQTAHVRVCFSMLSDEATDEAIRRLAAVLQN